MNKPGKRDDCRKTDHDDADAEEALIGLPSACVAVGREMRVRVAEGRISSIRVTRVELSWMLVVGRGAGRASTVLIPKEGGDRLSENGEQSEREDSASIHAIDRTSWNLEVI